MRHTDPVTAALERLWAEVPEHRHAAVLMEWFTNGEIDAATYCAAVEVLEDADASRWLS